MHNRIDETGMSREKVLYRSKRRVFRTYFLSNLVLIVVSLTLTTLFVSLSIGRMQRVIRLYNESVLKTAKSVIDERLSVAKTLALEIANDPLFTAFAQTGRELSAEDKYAASRLSERLNDFIVPYPFVSKILYYYRQADTIITNEYRYTPDSYYRVRIIGDSPDKELWLSLIRGKHSGGMELLSVQTAGARSERLMGLFLPSPYVGDQSSIGTICVLLGRGILGEHTNEILLNDSAAFFILDERGKALLGEGNQSLSVLLAGLPFPTAKDQPVLIDTVHQGDRYLVDIVSSGNGKLRYVSITPHSVFYNENAVYFQLVILFSVTSLGIGLILSFGMARSRSKPVQRIYGMILRQNALALTDGGNELEAIERSVEKLIDDERVSRTAVLKYRPFLRSSLLVQLLRTGLPLSRFDLYGELGLSFEGDSFAVALVRVIRSAVSTNAIQTEALCFTVAEMTENRTTDPGCHVVLGLDEATVGILFSLDRNDVRGAARIASAVADIMNRAQEVASISTKAGIGTTYPGLAGMHESYKEAEKALRYSDFHAAGSPILYSDIGKLKREFRFPNDLERSLRGHLKEGSTEKCLSTLRRIYDTNFSDPTMYFELAQCLFFELISTSLKSLAELKIDAPSIFGNGYNPYVQLPACATIEEMREQLDFIYTKASPLRGCLPAPTGYWTRTSCSIKTRVRLSIHG